LPLQTRLGEARYCTHMGDTIKKISKQLHVSIVSSASPFYEAHSRASVYSSISFTFTSPAPCKQKYCRPLCNWLTKISAAMLLKTTFGSNSDSDPFSLCCTGVLSKTLVVSLSFCRCGSTLLAPYIYEPSASHPPALANCPSPQLMRRWLRVLLRHPLGHLTYRYGRDIFQ